MSNNKRKRGKQPPLGIEADMSELAVSEEQLGVPMEVTVPASSLPPAGSLRVPKWTWRAFTSSARSDGLALKHWEKAAIVRDDYVFAQYCSKVPEVVAYNDGEYEQFCASTTWSKDMTDELMELARQFGCRWHVIADRFRFDKSLEEIKDRYYSVTRAIASAYCSMLTQESSITAKALAAKVPIVNKPYSADYEKKRKAQANGFFFATSAAIEEQEYLRSKLVEFGLAKPKPVRYSGKGAASRAATLKRVAAAKARDALRASLVKNLEMLRVEPASEPEPASESKPAPESKPEISGVAQPAQLEGEDDSGSPRKKAKRRLTLAETVATSKRLVGLSKDSPSKALRTSVGKTLTRLTKVLSKHPPLPKKGVVLQSHLMHQATNWGPHPIAPHTIASVNSFLDGIGLSAPLPTQRVIDSYYDLRGQTLVLAELSNATSALLNELETLRVRAAKEVASLNLFAADPDPSIPIVEASNPPTQAPSSSDPSAAPAP